MLSKNIRFLNYQLNLNLKKKIKKIYKIFDQTINEENQVINSLKNNYKDSYSASLINKYKKYKSFNLLGMGGSSLGFKSIYFFLSEKIKKKVLFIDNLKKNNSKNINKLNIIISKSGETIETIVNSNLYIKPSDRNIFITENKKNYLSLLAHKLKSEIVTHNNFIGGRFSVLSEVGMLPSELVGLKAKNFRNFNELIKKKFFLNSLISNVASTLYLVRKKKSNSIIINYDEKSKNIFLWYQQLIAESLGKKSRGILPIISDMPKDNHSVMQLYLDGVQNSFYTFFFVHDKKSSKINNATIMNNKSYLKNKDINQILYSLKLATVRVFKEKKIPFRNFELLERSEKTLGELFTFFILETILLGRALDVNPYDQPAVELIKKETKKILS